MKRKGQVFLLAMAMGMIMSLTACAGAQTVQVEREPNNGTAPTSIEEGYVFAAGQTEIPVDAPAAPVLERLGEAVSYYEAVSCAFDGVDKMYTYPGFELDTYPSADGDRISAVILRDDTVSTPEGVRIGDAAARVREVYPDIAGDVDADGLFAVEKNGTKLCFIMRDGTVASIEYRSAVLG